MSTLVPSKKHTNKFIRPNKKFEKIFEKVVDIPIFLCILQHISNGALENKIQGAFFVYLRVFILITKIKINGALKGDFIMAQSIPEIYGSLVFNDKIMREKLPKDMYKALKKTIENGTHLELDVANSVAVAMKEWALEHGATHYTHWFQPMTNFTAEKHDSFISPTGRMHPVSRQAVFVLHLKQEDIQHGILHHRHSSKTVPFISRLHSAPTAERHWIRKHLFFVPWIP